MISSSQERDVLAMLDKRLPRRGETVERLGLERKWLSNILYCYDKHYFTFAGYSPVEVKRGQNEIRSQTNYVKPAISRAVVKVLNIKGRFAAIPDGDTLEAREQARLGEIIFQHLRTATCYDREKTLMTFWAALCGSGFLKNVYDPLLGDTERFYHTNDGNKSVIRGNLLPADEKARKDVAGEFDEIPNGEISCEATSPFQMHEDPISKGKIEHCRFIFQQQWLPTEWIAERFNVDEKDLTIESNLTSANRLDQAVSMLSSGLTGFQPMTGGDERTRFKLSRLVQMWERPSRKNPKGRYVVVGGERGLIDEHNPYVGDNTAVCHIPFTKMDWMPVMGRFFGSALADSLTPLQYRYNESRSRTAEFENIYGRPIMILPKGAGLSKVNMEIKTGGVYEANTNAGTPTFFPQPALPPDVMQNSQTIAGEMRYISSQSDVDGSKMPGQIRSGAGLNALQRDRDLVLDLTIASSLEADRMSGCQQLTLAKMFYTTERIAYLRGPGGQWSSKRFKSGDFSNKIRIIGEPGEYQTSDQYKQELQDMVTTGMLQPATNPEDRQVIAKAIKFQSAEEIVVDLIQHEERQEQEIRDMMKAPQKFRDGVYPVLPYEDDQAHQRVLERLFNSDEFQDLDELTRSVLSAHWQAHDNQKMQKLAQQMQMMEASKGAPGQTGVASQPRR